ncbi:UNVERIFIED_CONTAM: hypothetical protein Sangu_1197000 [Sesamum angustifolium]|uniref:Uncharacterized protein n=1 Tax=Sesamum angustifolium TaxID=2727405 RepID=A0AAW2NIG9_9LAMI
MELFSKFYKKKGDVYSSSLHGEQVVESFQKMLLEQLALASAMGKIVHCFLKPWWALVSNICGYRLWQP